MTAAAPTPTTDPPPPPNPRGPASSPEGHDLDEGRSILSTLNDDGSRRWLKPRLSPGRFLSARRGVAYLLIAIFAAIPMIEINGKPAILLDIVRRKFTFFGTTFLPTDTLLMALILVGSFLTIFWVTALLGRVWCGWGCPQTVYLEFVYRPIERFFEGAPGRAKKGFLQTSGVGSILKYAVYLLVSFALAHIFLSYFVGWESLRKWVFGSPFEHPIGFGVVMFVTAAMMFDFSYFREQTCLVACPYGRFQSVLLDRQSMIIRYDTNRGEPRGKKPAHPRSTDVALSVLPAQKTAGDCIDCHMCVTTCPTGIDIRNGLQMECIGCAQCIDACDTVMDKIGRPRGLIRYSSAAAMSGEKMRLLRPRVVLYPAFILVIATVFVLVLAGKGIADVTVLRGLGKPFSQLPGGEVMNPVRVKIVNRTDTEQTFTLAVKGVDGARIATEVSPLTLAPGQMLTTPAQITVPESVFTMGKAQIIIRVAAAPPGSFSDEITYTLMGPGSIVHPKDAPRTDPAPAGQTVKDPAP